MTKWPCHLAVQWIKRMNSPLPIAQKAKKPQNPNILASVQFQVLVSRNTRANKFGGTHLEAGVAAGSVLLLGGFAGWAQALRPRTPVCMCWCQPWCSGRKSHIIITSAQLGPFLNPTLTLTGPWHKPGHGHGGGVGWWPLRAIPTCIPGCQGLLPHQHWVLLQSCFTQHVPAALRFCVFCYLQHRWHIYLTHKSSTSAQLSTWSLSSTNTAFPPCFLYSK